MDCNPDNLTLHVQMKSKQKKTKPRHGNMYILESSNLWIPILKTVLSHYFEVIEPINFIFINPVCDGLMLLATQRVLTHASSNCCINYLGPYI